MDLDNYKDTTTSFFTLDACDGKLATEIMNVLSLDPENLLVDKRQTKLIKELEKYKINPIPISLRHCYTHGGGIHCATLDTVREGKLESYF